MIRAVNARGMIVIAKGPHRGAALRFSARGEAGLRPREPPCVKCYEALRATLTRTDGWS